MQQEESQLIRSNRLTVLDVLHYADGIVELIADEGVTITAENVQELLDLIERLDPSPQAVLANRKNSYSFSFEAQRLLGEYRGVKAVAILTYSRIAFIAAKFVFAKYFKLGVFLDRQQALTWLRKELAK